MFPKARVLTTAALLATSGLLAQTAPSTPAQDWKVNAIRIDTGGSKSVSTDAVLASVGIKPGDTINAGDINRTVKALESSGRFDKISVSFAEPAAGAPPQSQDIVVRVTPRPRISQVIIKSVEYKPESLRDKVKPKSKDGGYLDEAAYEADARDIRDFYVKKGYLNAKVTPRIDRNPAEEVVTLTFDIEEGVRFHIDSIDFTGNHNVGASSLRGAIDTSTWKPIISWFTDGGRLIEPNLIEDLAKIRNHYRNLGYIDVQTPETDLKIVRDGDGSISITIPVIEGRKYQTGDISFKGNTLFAADTLARELRMKKGEIFTPKGLNDDVQRIKDAYGSLGYLDAQVSPEKVMNTSGTISVVYNINEGRQYFVESIRIEGNNKTKDYVILRELALAPGDVFNTVRMRNSRNHLRELNYFNTQKLSVTPETPVPDVEGRKDLKVKVEESPTGNLNFGVGFSTLDSLFVFAEVSQSNFDLFNSNPDASFQGDGQKGRLRVQLGARSSEFILSFEEPWLFERRLALGIDLFSTTTAYNAMPYDEMRTGFETYLRKRLVGLWEGRLSYRLESVDVSDVEPLEAPLIISEAEGTSVVSKVGLAFSHRTVDETFFPTEGHQWTINNEFAGLGGDAQFYKIEFRGAEYFALDEKRDHVIGVLGRIGSMFDTGEEIPFFERLYLGGPNSLRGFNYRHVGPMEQAPDGGWEPVGGQSYGLASVEYNYRIAEPIRFALFYDWGFLNADAGDFDPSDYNSNWGFGLRILLLGQPLRLDYAIPINTNDYNDDGGRFWISFGARF